MIGKNGITNIFGCKRCRPETRGSLQHALENARSSQNIVAPFLGFQTVWQLLSLRVAPPKMTAVPTKSENNLKHDTRSHKNEPLNTHTSVLYLVHIHKFTFAHIYIYIYMYVYTHIIKLCMCDYIRIPQCFHEVFTTTPVFRSSPQRPGVEIHGNVAVG